jgi:hypothetical protein
MVCSLGSARMFLEVISLFYVCSCVASVHVVFVFVFIMCGVTLFVLFVLFCLFCSSFFVCLVILVVC